MIKGHIHASLLNLENNNTELAVAHAGHPIGELYILIKDSREGSALAEDTKKRLEDMFNTMRTSLEDYPAKVDEVEKFLTELVTTVVGEDVEEESFIASVIIKLLEEAVVTAGEIENIIEYQDAQGFIFRANQLMNKIDYTEEIVDILMY